MTEVKFDQCDHLIKAKEFLKTNRDSKLRTQKAWLAFLTAKRLKEITTESALSAYFTANERNNYAHTRYYKDIIKIIDQYINVTYKHTWNESLKEYIDSRSLDVQKLRSIEKISGLNGVWKGYTWNGNWYDGEKKSDKNNGGLKRDLCIINVFKIQISNGSMVIAETKSNRYGGYIESIADGKFSINLGTDDGIKKRFCIGNVGTNGMKNVQGIKFVYVDSSTTNIRCGLGVMLRSKKSKYEHIQAVHSTVKEIELSHNLVEFLSGGDHERGTELSTEIFQNFDLKELSL